MYSTSTTLSTQSSRFSRQSTQQRRHQQHRGGGTCGPPKPLKAVWEAWLVLHTNPATLRAGHLSLSRSRTRHDVQVRGTSTDERDSIPKRPCGQTGQDGSERTSGDSPCLAIEHETLVKMIRTDKIQAFRGEIIRWRGVLRWRTLHTRTKSAQGTSACQALGIPYHAGSTKDPTTRRGTRYPSHYSTPR